MIVLGITRDNHDPSAAIVVDGKVVAAAEEERFVRRKHAVDMPPVNAAKYCLEAAGIRAGEVDAVAYPFSPVEYRRNRWHYALSTCRHLPWHAAKAILKTGSRWRKEEQSAKAAMRSVGIDPERTPFVPVGHHLSHACSAFFPSGFETALALTMDAMGEFDSAGAWVCGNRGLHKVFEVLLPASLGTFYTAVTEYLGFEPNDGEYKTMGMAAFGDPARADLGFACRLSGGFPVNDPRVVFPPSRFMKAGQRFHSDEFEKILGPVSEGDSFIEAHAHVAAAAQDLVERTVKGWLSGPLAPHLESCGGNLVMAGGVALNVKMNGALLDMPGVKKLWVQPCSGDAGGSLGAALFTAGMLGDRPAPMADAFLGPEHGPEEIEAALTAAGAAFTQPDDIALEAARIMSDGGVIARFDGRMEWGPRALGNRSILAHPGRPGTADRVNEAIKFREKWRPFCPAVLAQRAGGIFECSGELPYMTAAVRVRPQWRERIPEVVHADSTARIQTVDNGRCPGFHALISEFDRITGMPVVLNTSLNRRGEPIACTPADALRIFGESALDAMVMGKFLVRKKS